MTLSLCPAHSTANCLCSQCIASRWKRPQEGCLHKCQTHCAEPSSTLSATDRSSPKTTAMSLASISPHFTDATLDAIVQECGGTRHTGWHFGTGFKKGDSYLSETYRLHIDGLTAADRPLQVNAIVKAIPKNAARRQTFRSADFFANEVNFYRHVLGPMRQFQEASGVRAPHAFTEVPRLLHAYVDGRNDFIVLEDLRPAGYASAVRQDGMDLAHSRLVMRTLGKFHAVSLAIGDRQPELLRRMCADGTREVYYAPEFRDWYASFERSQIAVARDAMRREYGGTEYERRMVAFTGEGFYDRMCGLVQRRNRFSVIGHGDCWLPNFLLQYGADGQPQLAKMIDFQLGRFASPALDISFCVYSCTMQALRVEHYEELLKVYHDSACDLLTRLGCAAEQVYPWSALQDELHEAARFGVGMGMESLPMSILPDDQVADLDAMQGDGVPLADVWVIGPIEDDVGRRRLADMFRHAIDQGYLD